LDEACRTECLASPFARLDTPWFILVGIYEGVSVWEGITDTHVLLGGILNSVAFIQNIHQVRQKQPVMLQNELAYS
jgi:hypothetical protein